MYFNEERSLQRFQLLESRPKESSYSRIPDIYLAMTLNDARQFATISLESVPFIAAPLRRLNVSFRQTKVS